MPIAEPPTEPLETEDRALVARFLATRDEHAFRQLFRRHAGAMTALARRLLGPWGESTRDAEDAVQEAWLRAARGLGGFAWRSSLRTWLNGIAVRCCYEILRRREPGLDLAHLPTEPIAGPAPPETLDLERALRELPSGYRTVLLLHDVEGWTHAEIAERLGIEAGTSKSQLARARARLRARWSVSAPATTRPPARTEDSQEQAP